MIANASNQCRDCKVAIITRIACLMKAAVAGGRPPFHRPSIHFSICHVPSYPMRFLQWIQGTIPLFRTTEYCLKWPREKVISEGKQRGEIKPLDYFLITLNRWEQLGRSGLIKLTDYMCGVFVEHPCMFSGVRARCALAGACGWVHG